MKKAGRIKYYVTYERSGGGYVASAPAIPGCAVYGKTLEEAHRNIHSAVEECLEVIREFRRKTPRETVRPEEARRFSFVTLREYVEA